MEEEVCKVCGKTIPMGRRKYCSYECCRYANKHDLKNKHEEEPKTKVYKTFYCAYCEKRVEITSTKDKRKRFCSIKCERAYWKHSAEKKKRKAGKENHHD